MKEVSLKVRLIGYLSLLIQQHTYESFYMKGKTIRTENRLVVARGWEPKEGLTTKGRGELFRVVEMFYNLIIAMITWWYAQSKFTKLYAKKGNVTECKLCFDKPQLKKKLGPLAITRTKPKSQMMCRIWFVSVWIISTLNCFNHKRKIQNKGRGKYSKNTS